MRNYLKPLPQPNASEPPQRAVTVVSNDSRDVVYLDQSASIELITEALKAWGLRVRAERETPGRRAEASSTDSSDPNWQTTRPEGRAPTRLDNILSPLWLPTREHSGSSPEPPTDWDWFGRAA